MQNKIPPPIWMLMFGIVMWFVANSPYAYPFEVPNRWIMVAIFVVMGIGFAGTAINLFGKAETTVNPLEPSEATSLVTDGIYSKTRNPMYVGLLMLLAAWTMFLESLTNIAVTLLFIPVINYFQIRPEERALLEIFGEEYEAYCRKVRRWI